MKENGQTSDFGLTWKVISASYTDRNDTNSVSFTTETFWPSDFRNVISYPLFRLYERNARLRRRQGTRGIPSSAVC